MMRPISSPTEERLRWIELWLIFVVFPVGLYFVRHQFSRLIVPTLMITAAVCLLVLFRDHEFDRRCLGLNKETRNTLVGILRTFVPGALALAVAVALLRPDLLFAFPRQEPGWWLVVMILYPLLSVYPQELLFRTFFFQRYRRILRTPTARVLGSAFVFGIAHL